MKLARIAAVLAGALLLPMQFALPAQAATVDTANSDDSTNAVGFIVQYKKGVSFLAPNSEPTGENFAGVDLENTVQLNERLASIDFVHSLSDSEANESLIRLRSDPRVESVEFNRFIESAGVRNSTFESQIIQTVQPVTLPIIAKSAVTRATIAPIGVADSWQSGTTPRVKISWSKPTSRYTGTLVGFRVQMKISGTWVSLKSQTYASTRSYSSSSSYLKAGTKAEFRVAAITKRYSTSYVGYYKYASVTPTTAPRAVNVLEVTNNQNNLEVSWTPYTSISDRGGLGVTYQVSVTKTSDGSSVTCTTSALNTCVTSGTSSGNSYTAKLTISNSKGSVFVTKSVSINVSTPVSSSNDTKYSFQWFLKSSETYSAKVSDAWTIESGSEDIIVAVLDTGYTDHPDLDSNILPGYDMISSSSSANDGNGRDNNARDVGDYQLNPDGSLKENSSWHGTHVAGIIAASDNSEGVIGIAPNVKILPVRVLGSDGGTTADIVSGIYWAAGISRVGVPNNPNKASVINISIGGNSSGCDSGTEAALSAAKTAGVTVITAAGNDNPVTAGLAYASLSYPGNCYPTINVGSSGKQGKPAFYSNFSNDADQFNSTPYGVDISAPGGDYCQGGAPAQIYSTINSGTQEPGVADYSYEIGTSMAAPVVSGTVALMYSARLRENPNQVFNGAFVDSIWFALKTTSTPFASTSPVNCAGTGLASIEDGGAYGGYGVGIVNAKSALDAFLQ